MGREVTMKDEIPIREKEDAFAAIAIAVMLILTAWGNAIAMMVGSLIGFVIMALVFKKKLHHGVGLAVVVALVVVASLAIALFLGWKD